MSTSDKSILIVCDSADELRAVRELMTSDLGNYWSTDNEAGGLQLFQEHRPSVLILAFQEIEKAERFYLTLYRQCPQMQEIRHQTLLLCKNTEAESAYSLCMNGTVDDYVVNRPLYDPFRLRLSVHQALGRRNDEQKSTAVNSRIVNIGKGLQYLDNYVGARLASGESQSAESLRALQGLTAKLSSQIKQFEESYKLPPLGKAVQGPGQNTQKSDGHQTEGTSKDAPSSPPEIMVVDDDEIYTDVLVAIIEGGGLRATSVDGGEAALAMLRQRRPDLMLMDYQMPGMDGLQTLRRMKMDPDLKFVKVVMLTGTSERELVSQCIQAGAADFIVKPSDRVTILAKINAQLGQ
ncbi:MAG: response regulator [Betaproteobacteria bacterium]|nr:response regulator [Betaproteobacteria bacterium]